MLLNSKKKEHDISEAYNFIDNVKETIDELRGKIDEHFKVWLKDAEDLAESVGTTITTPRVTGRQRHRANA